MPEHICRCAPRMNVGGPREPFNDRVVFLGDSGVARLYKDGIGSAYRTAKAAARTAVFHGISEADFEKGFWPECKALIVDNRIVVVGEAAEAADHLCPAGRIHRRAHPLV